MRAVVGLGNPGARYERTRHNVGFMVVDELARRRALHWTLGPANRIAYTSLRDNPIVLIEPQMFMNCSGEAIANLTPFPRADETIVVHDDLDLDCGTVRVKQGGGTAGHRGLQSLAEVTGPELTRVRVGIGRPAQRSQVQDYVLAPFDERQVAAISAAIHTATDALECILENGTMMAMNRFNVRRTETQSDQTLIGRN